MALLLNRKYGSRLECIYYILQSCYAKYGTTQKFTLGDLKFDPDDDDNVHKYCKQLIDCIGIPCCPFLQNPLNSSKCYATQSVDSDSTKSKAVSDIGGSLEALGFITRVDSRAYRVSATGEKWAKTDINTQAWLDIAREGVLSYGVIIGFLSKLTELPDTFSYSGLYLSYPKTDEIVPYTDPHGHISYISISTDSQRDSNTRTMSRLIGWCVAVGLLEPKGVAGDASSSLAHIKYREFLNAGELTIRTFKKTALCKSVFDTVRYVANPLSYKRLHKNVGSLRENGGEDLRRATMEYNENIINRRFVFVYALNHCAKAGRALDFQHLVDIMSQPKYARKFFSPGNDGYDIMSAEAEIADISGIPFEDNDGMLNPLTSINENVLKEEAPTSAVRLAESIVAELG